MAVESNEKGIPEIICDSCESKIAEYDSAGMAFGEEPGSPWEGIDISEIMQNYLGAEVTREGERARVETIIICPNCGGETKTPSSINQ